MKALRILQDSVTGRAVVFFGFAAFLSFLVVMYSLLQEQDYARLSHRARTDALFSLKAAYQDYETTLLMHVADPQRVVVSDAQKRFNLMADRLVEAQEAATDPEARKTLMYLRRSMAKINPSAFHAVGMDGAVQGQLRDMLLAMTTIQTSLLGLDTALAERGAELDAGQRMHNIAEVLMGFSAVALLLLIGRLLITQSNVLQVLKIEKASVDQQSVIQLAAIEAARDGIVILDAAGRIIFMNRAFSLLHFLSGLGRKESIGKPWAELYNAEGAKTVRDVILPAVREKGFWHGESALTNTRGQPFAAYLSLTALPEGGFIGMAQDVREKREREKETEDLRLQYYQAQKMESLGRLAGGIAHDFNNILAAISGYAEFLTQDLDKGAPTHGFAEKILLATTRAKGLIEQILTFSRTNDQGKTDIDLKMSTAEVVSMLRASIGSGVAIETDAPDSAIVSANPTQVSQALMNLCVNAQDAMDGKGRLRITLGTAQAGDLDVPVTQQVDQYPDGNRAAPVYLNTMGQGRTLMVVGHAVQGQRYARLSVSDTGSGIPRPVMEHMFEPFFTTKDVHKGTGLGLAAVHGIVISHKGFLIIDSHVGQGSSFHMMFPLKGMSMVSVADIDEEVSDIVHSGRILVVDDHDEVRTTTCMMLERAGYEVFDSKTPEEALALITDNPDHFDLVITDFAMPGMTGVELAQAAAGAAPNLKFALISGYAEAETREKIASVPMIKDTIKKPVSSGELARRVGALLAASQD